MFVSLKNRKKIFQILWKTREQTAEKYRIKKNKEIKITIYDDNKLKK